MLTVAKSTKGRFSQPPPDMQRPKFNVDRKLQASLPVNIKQLKKEIAQGVYELDENGLPKNLA